MENILIDNENDVRYVIMVEGQEMSIRYQTPAMAEMQIQQLPEEMRAKAVVVPVTEGGQQVLLG